MLSKFMGPRYAQLLRTWRYNVRRGVCHLFFGYSEARVPTMTMWGSVGAVGLVWATDWRLILDYVPYINGKFKKDD